MHMMNTNTITHDHVDVTVICGWKWKFESNITVTFCLLAHGHCVQRTDPFLHQGQTSAV